MSWIARNEWLGKRLLVFILAASSATLNTSCRDDATTGGSSEIPPIEMRGSLEAARAATIVAQIDGSVATVSAKEGDPVAAGAELVTLDNVAMSRDRELAQNELAIAQARAGGSALSSPTIGTAEREEVEQLIRTRREHLERYRALRKTNDVTQRDLEQAESEYAAALRAVRGTAAAPSPRAESEVRRLELERARMQARFAEERMAVLHVKSPLAGTVTKVHVAPAQAVFPRDPLVDVTDVSTMRARAEIAPELARFVRAGTNVDVRVLSVPVRTFSAEVERVVGISDPSSGSRQSVVYAIIPNPDGSLQPNTPITMSVRNPR